VGDALFSEVRLSYLSAVFGAAAGGLGSKGAAEGCFLRCASEGLLQWLLLCNYFIIKYVPLLRNKSILKKTIGGTFFYMVIEKIFVFLQFEWSVFLLTRKMNSISNQNKKRRLW